LNGAFEAILLDIYCDMFEVRDSTEDTHLGWGDFDIQMVLVLADRFQKTFKLRSRFRTAEKWTVEICSFCGISMTFGLKFSDSQSVGGAGARFRRTRLRSKAETARDRR
jgi:hypothetical protein